MENFFMDHMEYLLCRGFAAYCEDVSDIPLEVESGLSQAEKRLECILTVFDKKERTVKIVRTNLNNFGTNYFRPSRYEETRVLDMSDEDMMHVAACDILRYQQGLTNQFEKIECSHKMDSELKKILNQQFQELTEEIAHSKLTPSCSSVKYVIIENVFKNVIMKIEKFDETKIYRKEPTNSTITKHRRSRSDFDSLVNFPEYKIITRPRCAFWPGSVLYQRYKEPPIVSIIQKYPFDWQWSDTLYFQIRKPDYLSTFIQYIERFHPHCVGNFNILLFFHQRRNTVQLMCDCKLGDERKKYFDVVSDEEHRYFEGSNFDAFVERYGGEIALGRSELICYREWIDKKIAETGKDESFAAAGCKKPTSDMFAERYIPRYKYKYKYLTETEILNKFNLRKICSIENGKGVQIGYKGAPLQNIARVDKGQSKYKGDCVGKEESSPSIDNLEISMNTVHECVKKTALKEDGRIEDINDIQNSKVLEDDHYLAEDEVPDEENVSDSDTEESSDEEDIENRRNIQIQVEVHEEVVTSDSSTETSSDDEDSENEGEELDEELITDSTEEIPKFNCLKEKSEQDLVDENKIPHQETATDSDTDATEDEDGNNHEEVEAEVHAINGNSEATSEEESEYEDTEEIFSDSDSETGSNDEDEEFYELVIEPQDYLSQTCGDFEDIPPLEDNVSDSNTDASGEDVEIEESSVKPQDLEVTGNKNVIGVAIDLTKNLINGNSEVTAEDESEYEDTEETVSDSDIGTSGDDETEEYQELVIEPQDLAENEVTKEEESSSIIPECEFKEVAESNECSEDCLSYNCDDFEDVPSLEDNVSNIDTNATCYCRNQEVEESSVKPQDIAEDEHEDSEETVSDSDSESNGDEEAEEFQELDIEPQDLTETEVTKEEEFPEGEFNDGAEGNEFREDYLSQNSENFENGPFLEDNVSDSDTDASCDDEHEEVEESSVEPHNLADDTVTVDEKIVGDSVNLTNKSITGNFEATVQEEDNNEHFEDNLSENFNDHEENNSLHTDAVSDSDSETSGDDEAEELVIEAQDLAEHAFTEEEDCSCQNSKVVENIPPLEDNVSDSDTDTSCDDEDEELDESSVEQEDLVENTVTVDEMNVGDSVNLTKKSAIANSEATVQEEDSNEHFEDNLSENFNDHEESKRLHADAVSDTDSETSGDDEAEELVIEPQGLAKHAVTEEEDCQCKNCKVFENVPFLEDNVSDSDTGTSCDDEDEELDESSVEQEDLVENTVTVDEMNVGDSVNLTKKSAIANSEATVEEEDKYERPADNLSENFNDHEENNRLHAEAVLDTDSEISGDDEAEELVIEAQDLAEHAVTEEEDCSFKNCKVFDNGPSLEDNVSDNDTDTSCDGEDEEVDESSVEQEDLAENTVDQEIVCDSANLTKKIAIGNSKATVEEEDSNEHFEDNLSENFNDHEENKYFHVEAVSDTDKETSGDDEAEKLVIEPQDLAEHAVTEEEDCSFKNCKVFENGPSLKDNVSDSDTDTSCDDVDEEVEESSVEQEDLAVNTATVDEMNVGDSVNLTKKDFEDNLSQNFNDHVENNSLHDETVSDGDSVTSGVDDEAEEFEEIAIEPQDLAEYEEVIMEEEFANVIPEGEFKEVAEGNECNKDYLSQNCEDFENVQPFEDNVSDSDTDVSCDDDDEEIEETFVELHDLADDTVIVDENIVGDAMNLTNKSIIGNSKATPNEEYKFEDNLIHNCKDHVENNCLHEKAVLDSDLETRGDDDEAVEFEEIAIEPSDVAEHEENAKEEEFTKVILEGAFIKVPEGCRCCKYCLKHCYKNSKNVRLFEKDDANQESNVSTTEESSAINVVVQAEESVTNNSKAVYGDVKINEENLIQSYENLENIQEDLSVDLFSYGESKAKFKPPQKVKEENNANVPSKHTDEETAAQDAKLNCEDELEQKPDLAENQKSILDSCKTNEDTKGGATKTYISLADYAKSFDRCKEEKHLKDEKEISDVILFTLKGIVESGVLESHTNVDCEDQSKSELAVVEQRIEKTNDAEQDSLSNSDKIVKNEDTALISQARSEELVSNNEEDDNLLFVSNKNKTDAVCELVEESDNESISSDGSFVMLELPGDIDETESIGSTSSDSSDEGFIILKYTKD